ncbi:hypothetical protein PENSPDRAFT_147831 [Peniophora sp. CONT]|nr:hypothetical protein PENSPDRAFT_147831 [Peniophora sp. CONT]
MDSVKPLEHLREELKSDATPVTARLRTSWNTVSAEVTLDAGGPGADTLDSFGEIVKDIYHGVEACQQDEENAMSSEDWSQVYNAGLPDLILDMIMENHFFSLPRPYLVEWILNIHLRLSYINDDWVKTHGSRALQRLDALWAAFWDNRHRITDWSSHRPPGIGEHPILQALEVYHSIHELTCVHPGTGFAAQFDVGTRAY